MKTLFMTLAAILAFPAMAADHKPPADPKASAKPAPKVRHINGMDLTEEEVDKKGTLTPDAQAELNRAMQELQAEDDQRAQAAKAKPRKLAPVHTAPKPKHSPKADGARY